MLRASTPVHAPPHSTFCRQCPQPAHRCAKRCASARNNTSLGVDRSVIDDECSTSYPVAPPSRSRRALLAGLAGAGVVALPLAAKYPVTAAETLFAEDFFARWSYMSPTDILAYVYETAPKGNTEAILQAIDKFSEYYPMYKIGAEKGLILEAVVKQAKPQLALELGTFIGYSAIRTARCLPPGGKLVCVEANPQNAEAARAMIEYAGLSSKVVLVEGLSNNVLADICKQYGRAGFVFEDHCKQCYYPDLLQMEGLGIVGDGTWLLADNVLYPGAPDLLEHLRSSGKYAAAVAGARYEYDQKWKEDWEPKDDGMAVAVYLSPGASEQAGSGIKSELMAGLSALCSSFPNKCTAV